MWSGETVIRGYQCLMAMHIYGLKNPTDAFSVITAYKNHAHVYLHLITTAMSRKDKRNTNEHTVGVHTLGSPRAKLASSVAIRHHV